MVFLVIYYRLSGVNAAASILRETLKQLKKKPEMRRDVARLSAACCAPQKYELLQAAPQPAVLSSLVVLEP
jgi:hypothetical protein